MIKHFELKIYRGKTVTDTPEYSAIGGGDDWVNHIRLKFSGFNGSISLSLEDFWRNVLNNKIESCNQLLEGYETIIKHENTMLLREPFTVELRAEF
ncbi:MAG: hypothetical protein KAI84_13540 [Gammaproteobacteria bacterium]|nr:hypothetical protein [Gammaproteobacteria bacterium]